MKNHRLFLLACASPLTLLCSHATAQDIVPPAIYTMTPTGVNLSDGTYTSTDVDLAIGALKLERYHQGGERDPNNPAFGYRTSHNFDIYVTAANRTECSPGSCLTYKRPVVHIGRSAANFYQGGTVILPSNDDNMAGDLVLSSGAYVYTNKDGDVYTFSTSVSANGSSSSKRVANIQFTNGRRQDFYYSGNYLKVVIDSSGSAIVFEYNGSNLVSKACGYDTAATYVSSSSTCSGATLSVTYGYTSSKLTSVTDGLSGVTTYEYPTAGFCVKPPGYTTCKVANTYSTGTPYPWQVVSQTLADGAVWSYSYSGDGSTLRSPEQYVDLEPTFTATVTDPNNKVSTYSFVMSSPYSVTDANNRTTEYRFLGGCFAQYHYSETTPDCTGIHYGAALVEATLPEGNKYQAQYSNVRRMVTQEKLIAKSGSSLADITTSTSYPTDCSTSPNTPQNCAKPIWARDAKGNQTDYAHNSWGGITSEMQPAPSSGAARPLKLYDYVQKYAYVKN
ncbi:MAG TPA: hypothetical protein VF617_01395, partial [Sphingomonas sp.]